MICFLTLTNMINSYQELKVWQKGTDLVVRIYSLVDLLPKDDTLGLISQMTRAAISIPANIAEGYRRNSTKDYCRFLRIAFGSGAELETYVIIIRKINFIPEKKLSPVIELLSEVMKMLNGLIRKVSSQN